MWLPQPGRPQLDAYYSDADTVLFGGSAGGAKSDLLLGLALTQHKDSIIFRREYSQMAGSSGIISRSRQIIGSQGRYNSQEHTWWDLPGDRTLEFGAVAHEDQKGKFRGRPHDFIGVDEAAEFPEGIVKFLVAWLRTSAIVGATESGQRCRIVMCSNPPANVEGEWLIRMFRPWLDPNHINPAESGELRWFAMIDDKDTEVPGPEFIDHNGEILHPKSRTFIPSRVSDNPYLYDNDYESMLQGLAEPLRSQLLHGSFTKTMTENPWCVIPVEWIRAAQERWKNTPKPDVPLSALGVDVARGGADHTVLSERYENWFAHLHKYPGSSTPNGPSVAALVMSLLPKEGATVNVDIIGVGGSVYDCLTANDLYVNGVNFAEKSYEYDRSGKLKMRNIRAEAYWSLREALDPEHGDDLCLPPDPELLADLAALTWSLSTAGVLLDSKDAVKKRIGRSPDAGDAIALSHYLSNVGSMVVVIG